MSHKNFDLFFEALLNSFQKILIGHQYMDQSLSDSMRNKPLGRRPWVLAVPFFQYL